MCIRGRTINVSAGRKGNFENETIAKISGNIASLKIGNAEKNGVLSLKSVPYTHLTLPTKRKG